MKRFLSISAAAKEFGISRDVLYRLAYSDTEFPGLKVNSYTKVNTHMLQEYLDKKTINKEAISG